MLFRSKKDPLPTYRKRLLKLGLAEASLEAIEAETEAMIDEATETARNSNPPPEDIAYTDLWADGSATWRN